MALVALDGMVSRMVERGMFEPNLRHVRRDNCLGSDLAIHLLITMAQTTIRLELENCFLRPLDPIADGLANGIDVSWSVLAGYSPDGLSPMHIGILSGHFAIDVNAPQKIAHLVGLQPVGNRDVG